jgi:uncharacterized protein (DUF2336 family)
MNAASPSKLHDLIALAQEPSSERRRELLRGVTDLFFAMDDHGPAELGLFDDVMTDLATEMEAAVRVELAERLGQASVLPSTLARRLGCDQIAVAAPILKSRALSDEDLISVAGAAGQDHLRVISQRPHISPAVSDAIVARGDDNTLGVLLRNETAQLSRQAHETVVDRALMNADLHEAVVKRASVPPDLLNEMYFVVETKLRDEIMKRNSAMDPAALELALAAGRNRLAARDGILPEDYADAEIKVSRMIRTRSIEPEVLASWLREGQMTMFTLALAKLADIDFHTAAKILERRELDALAIVCRAAKFEPRLFLTFAVLIQDKDANAIGRAREYGALYDAVTPEAALRTIRFWRMRRQTGDGVAA